MVCVHGQQVAFRCANYGAVFIGHGAAEVLGDYGAVSLHSPLMNPKEVILILEQPLL